MLLWCSTRGCCILIGTCAYSWAVFFNKCVWVFSLWCLFPSPCCRLWLRVRAGCQSGRGQPSSVEERSDWRAGASHRHDQHRALQESRFSRRFVDTNHWSCCSLFPWRSLAAHVFTFFPCFCPFYVFIDHMPESAQKTHTCISSVHKMNKIMISSMKLVSLLLFLFHFFFF